MKIKGKTIILFVGILIILLIHIIVYYAVLREFYNISNKEFTNPGVYSSFDEQGIAYDERTNMFLFCGYMRDKTASAVYVVDPKYPQNPHRISLKNMDGSDFIGHAGGIAVHGEYVYIAGSTDDCLYVFDRNSIVSSQNSFSQCIGVFPLKTSEEDGIRASFLGISDDETLLVGEFNFELIPQLRCRESHKHRFDNKKTNAFLAVFRFDADKPLGLEEKPSSVICISDKIQGVALSNGRLILSQSFGLSASSIRYYEYSKKTLKGTVNLFDSEIPLYVLSDPYRIVKAFPLTEGIAVVDDKVYISSELSNFFPKKLFKLFAPEWCYSLQVF